MTAQVLLKARPTAAQLADRLAPPVPDGLELYLDTADLASNEAMDGVVTASGRVELPAGFTLLVEGPDPLLGRRVLRPDPRQRGGPRAFPAARRPEQRIGARGANVHAIAPDADPAALTPENRSALLEQAVGPARYFAELALAAGIMPTVENMPPILRMRESGFYYSAIGMPPQDLTELVARVAGLRVVLDVSHAQLYLNVRRGVDEPIDGHDIWPAPPIRRRCAGSRHVPGLRRRARRRRSSHATSPTPAACSGRGCRTARATSIWTRSCPRWRSGLRYLVTETLEPDNDRAVLMRDAQARMLRALGRA